LADPRLGRNAGLPESGPKAGAVDKPSNRRMTMNWEQVKGNWNQAKGKIEARWGNLGDDDLTRIGGEKDKLLGAIQEHYGVSKEEAERQVDGLNS
jgi:uncharacterized protein YjbJ (UPF0337 family)